ncbi:MAG TPA: Trp biosynthesis-associated membrane protein [Jatrophihabitantaceae bacterium]|jgi:uncharacterized membrane protein (TIGR02234 family)|nr:Trp biosynthesis-associated membrane protein [Jatrophihabitantaceae bacterium]
MTSRAAFGTALGLDLVGAATALLVSARPWQTVATHRPRPLSDTLLHVSGRTIDAAPTALGVVALAGLVAVLAIRGQPRRVVGALLALAGAALVWRSISGATAISVRRAQSLVTAKHPGIALVSGTHVAVHDGWPALSTLAGVLVVAGGTLIAARGHRWAGMSARYESPSRPDDRARADASLWTALERGEDPTAAGNGAG